MKNQSVNTMEFSVSQRERFLRRLNDEVSEFSV